jgi:hypothetical protein
MQAQNLGRNVFGRIALGLMLGMLAILGCESDGDIARQASLRGSEEVPPLPVPTNASGSTILTFSGDLTQIAYTLNYTGLANVRQGHIHVGAAGTAGPVILFLCATPGFTPAPPVPAPPTCPPSAGTVTGTLTAANLIPRPANTPAINTFADAANAILAGNTYTNVHTDDGVAPPNTGPGDFPAGEIRGQNLH